jgi:hypothetical protein
MKRYVIAMVLGLSALGAMAQDATNEVKADATAQVPASPSSTTEVAGVPQPDVAHLPAGVVTEQNPLKKDFLVKAKLQPAVFRPGPSMPEITNEELLRGMVDTGKAPNKTGRITIGYMPKIKVLPCAKGCEGSDYERAVKEFVKGYRGEGKLFEERGELIVQVRWFKVRPYLMVQMPYGADEFGISFMLEGKVVTLGKNSGVGKTIYARELARDIGARLAVDLAYSMGAGGRSNILLAAEVLDGNFATGVSNVHTGINGALGVTDTRSRIEPATSEHANLLPAFDGIMPNEVAPIKQMFYLNSLLY